MSTISADGDPLGDCSHSFAPNLSPLPTSTVFLVLEPQHFPWHGWVQCFHVLAQLLTEREQTFGGLSAVCLWKERKPCINGISWIVELLNDVLQVCQVSGERRDWKWGNQWGGSKESNIHAEYRLQERAVLLRRWESESEQQRKICKQKPKKNPTSRNLKC